MHRARWGTLASVVFLCTLALSILVLARFRSRQTAYTPDPREPAVHQQEAQLEKSRASTEPNRHPVDEADEHRDDEAEKSSALSPWSVVGTCLLESGGSAVDVHVQVFDPYHDPPYALLGEGSSSEEGRFSVPLVRVPETPLYIRLRSAGRSTRHNNLVFPADRGVLDLGEVTLYPGFGLSGWVLDGSGNPIPDVTLSLASPGDVTDSMGPDYVARIGARTEDDGSFAVHEPLRAGPWSIQVRGRGISRCDPEELEALPGESVSVSVVCESNLPISGTVVGIRLPPIEASYVRAWAPDLATPASLPAKIAEDGSFRLIPDGTAESPVLVGIEVGPYEAEPVEAHWGDSIALLATELPRARLVVRDPAGQPLEDYAISLRSDPCDYRAAAMSRHIDGATDLVGSSTSGDWLYVVPDAGLAPRGPIRVDPADSQIEVSLSEARTSLVAVEGPGGQVVSGAVVELIGTTCGVSYDGTIMVVPGRAPAFFSGKGRGVEWWTATTGAAGVVSVEWPELRGWRYWFHVSAEGHGDVAVEVGEGGESEYTITLRTGPRVRGRLSGDWPSDTRLFLEQRADLATSRCPVRVGEESGDRPFESGSVGPGSWRIAASVLGVTVELGSVEVRASADPSAVIDAGDFEAAGFLGQGGLVSVFRDGQRVLHGAVEVYDSADARERPLASLPLRGGTLSLPRLPFGTYRLVLDDEAPLLLLVDGQPPDALKF